MSALTARRDPPRSPWLLARLPVTVLIGICMLGTATMTASAQVQRGSTTPIPRIEPGPPIPVRVTRSEKVESPTVEPTDGDPQWILLDSFSLCRSIPARSRWALKIDRETERFVEVPAAWDLAVEAAAAVESAPVWLREDLYDNLRRLPKGTQRTYASQITSAADNIRDEVAFSVAHLSPYTLTQMAAQIVAVNAAGIYRIARDLQYVRLVEYGNVASGDWHTTTEYRIITAEGDTVWREIPRDVYYWSVLMPKLSDEEPLMNASVYNEFWRDHLYEKADSGYPILKDAMRLVRYLWDGKSTTWANQDAQGQGYPFSDTMCAVQALGQWVHHQVPEMAQPPRPVQPNQILHHHFGNCGELQDLATAAARTALIPVQAVGSFPGDHSWAEIFYDTTWNYWDIWRDGGPTLIQAGRPTSMSFNTKACITSWRADGRQVPVNSHYTDVFTLRVVATDSHGKPVDGAEVFLAAGGYQYPTRPDSGFYIGTWGHTNHLGVFEIELGTDIAYGLRVDWQKGGAPSSANQFSLIDVSQATPGHVVQVDVRLPGSKDSISKVRATTSTGAYMVRLSGKVPRSRSYGGKMWQVSSFNLDNRDYAEVEEGGSMAVFLSDSTNYSAYHSGSGFEAAQLEKYYSAGGLNLVSPFVRGSFYLVLSGEMSARNSATPDLWLELYRDPSSVIREELPAWSGNSLRIGEVANRFPIDIEFAIISTGHAEVLVHDVLGNPVGTLASGSLTAGEHHLSWRGDENGRLANGVYVVTLRTGEGLVSRKVVVAR